MKSIEHNTGHFQSAWNWGVLWLLLALVMTLGLGEVASAATRTINLNTGYDQWAASSALITVGGLDNEWRVMTDPNQQPPPPPPATGRPANVVSDVNWYPNYSGSGNYPNSAWISINLSANPQNPPPSQPKSFEYAYYFTLPPGFSNAQLTMKLSADDHITQVTLNGNVLFQGSGGIFNNPTPLPISSTVQSHFTSGSTVNVLTVTVEDTAGGGTGLIVDGTVTYDDCDRRPVSQTPGLQSITFFESTFAPTSTTFASNSLQLITQLSGTLGSGNSDFQGVPSAEFYDVFISNWDGTVNPNGAFVTIEAVWNVGAPSGGGLNIGAVQLNFSVGPPQLANFVSSFVALGDNAMPNDVGRAVDTSTVTDTTMGNTSGQTQRLRVTVGFPCCVPPPSGMVAWWPLDELIGATVVTNIVNSGYNGIPVPSPIGPPNSPRPTTSTITPPAVVGGALYFYGQGPQQGFVQVPNATPLNIGIGDFTIDAWVFPVNVGAEFIQPIVDKLDFGANSGYALYIKSPGISNNARLEFVWGNGTLITTVQSISPITYNNWHHIAVTFKRLQAINPGDPTFELKMYVDGASAGAQSGSPPGGVGTIANTLDLLIGGARANIIPAGAGWGEIALDELEIFNVALPQSDIQAIYNAGSAGKCKPCVPPPSNLAHWWPLDEAAGSTAHDITGGRDGATQVGAIGSPGSPNSAAGQVGTAFAFDGNSAFVTVPDVPGTLSFGNLGQEFSIDAWINVKSADASGVRPIVDKRNEIGGRVAGYQLYLQNGNLSFQLADGIGPSNFCDVNPAAPLPGTSCTNYVSTANVADGQWHHVAVTVERTGAAPSVRLYVDGVLQFTGPTRIHANNNAALLIAKNNPAVSFSGQFFKGSIDELEIFSRVLNLADIQAIYDAPGGKCKKFVNLSITPTNPTTNPITVTYATSGCAGNEMFLVLDASAAPNAVPGLVPFPLSYLNTSGAWQPWPTPLSLTTPWLSSGPADGLYTLFSGGVPTGQYTLYLGCDFVPNGHLDIDANLNVNGVYDALNVTVQ